MPSFYDAERRFVLSTSFKVMYTTLMQQPSLRPLKQDAEAALRLWLQPGLRRYLLVRNPYDRLVSFHADKLGAAAMPRTGASWQECQRIFFPLLGLRGNEPAEAITARLRATDFDAFAALLPRAFRADPHLWPQSWSRSFRVGPLWIPARVDQVLKSDDHDPRLADELGLDLSIRANQTQHAAAATYFSAASYAVVNQIYREDFEPFGYRRVSC